MHINHILKDVVPALVSGAPIINTMHQRLQTDCEALTFDCVSLRYLSVFPTGTSNTNQLYFLSLGGLDLLVNIYRLIHQLPWHKFSTTITTVGVRQMIVDNGIMEMVFKTMNRGEIAPNE